MLSVDSRKRKRSSIRAVRVNLCADFGAEVFRLTGASRERMKPFHSLPESPDEGSPLPLLWASLSP